MADQRNSNGENIGITWCDATINLWWGCAKVHTGCKNCYAEHLSDVRHKNGLWGENTGRKRIKSAFRELDKYQAKASELGIKQKIFIGSMMDIFEESKELLNPVDQNYHTTDDLRQHLFSRISMGFYDNLIFLFLTKRPENIWMFIPEAWKASAPENVWFGTSISNEETEIFAVKLMLTAPETANLFLSVEPQIGDVSLKRINKLLFKAVGDDYDLQPVIKWIIQGGESGHSKRPFDLQWADALREECKTENVAYFFKQIDKIQEIPESYKVREFPFVELSNDEKINIGDKVRVEKGNYPIYTVQHIKGKVLWFEETNDNCFMDECTKMMPSYNKDQKIK